MGKKVKDACSGCQRRTFIDVFSKLCKKCEKEIEILLKRDKEEKQKKE